MIVSWLLLLGVAVPGALSVEIETTVDSILDKTGAPWATYEESKALFGGDEIVVVMLADEEPFSERLLTSLVALSDELSGLDGVRRVDSLSTVRTPTVGGGAGAFLAPLVDRSDPLARSPEELLDLVRDDPFSSSNLASGSGQQVAINLWLDATAIGRVSSIVGEIERIAEPYEALLSGVPVFRAETNRRTQLELLTLAPLTLLALALISALVFRAWLLVVVPLLASGVATVLVLGVMGYLGVPLTVSTLILPTVLLALGVAYSAHLLFAATRADAEQREEALLKIALPVALSGLTTAIGFVAISLVRIEAIRQIGGFGALGSLISTLVALTAVPAALRLHARELRLPAASTRLHDLIVGRALALVVRSPGPILIASVLLAGAATLGVARLNVESDVVLWFPEDDPIRRDYAQIGADLSGISPMNVTVTAEAGGISTPEAMRALSEFSAHLSTVDDVGKALSIADVVGSLNSALNEGRPLELSDQAQVEQYLLLLEGDERSRDLISADRATANVLLRADNNGSERLLSIAEEAERWWGEFGVSGSEATATGVMFEFARAEDAIAWGQVYGLGLAVLAIGVLLWLSFGSIQLSLVALVPNVFPIAVALGALGWLGLPLDAGTVLVGNLALGIAVDDTVHLLAGVSAGREAGDSWTDAVAASMRRVAAPILFTTASLVVGFAALGVSGFLFIRNLGLLTAAVLFLCLLADLLVLPAVLRLTDLGERGSST